MSAVLSSSFHAHLVLAAGVTVHLEAPTLDQLQAVVAKLTPAANDGRKESSKPAAKAEEAGNASASTGTQASAPPAAAGSAPAADAPRPTYDDVKGRVLKLAKVNRETATAALAKFGVDHGNKLKPEQYADFLKHADGVLANA